MILRNLVFVSYHNISNWRLEELVWERIWKQKYRWTKQELIDSYKYYRDECLRQGAEPKIIDELEQLLK